MRKLNLRLFDEGAQGVTQGAAAPEAEGQKSAASAETGEAPVLRTRRGTPIYAPKQTPESPKEVRAAGKEDSPQGEETFDSLIKGKFRNEYNANVQKIVQSRLKNSKSAEETIGKLAPLLAEVGKRYGVDTSDLTKVDFDKLAENVVTDRKYLEEEAQNKGVDVNQLRNVKELEYQNKLTARKLSKSIQEQQNRIRFNRIANEGTAVKAVYPSFSLTDEIQNPAFLRLVNNNVPVRTAYEVVHKDQIMAGAMQYTAQKVQQKVANSIRAQAARPVENGVTSQAASVTEADIRTKQYREQIKQRVRRGERVVL